MVLGRYLPVSLFLFRNSRPGLADRSFSAIYIAGLFLYVKINSSECDRQQDSGSNKECDRGTVSL